MQIEIFARGVPADEAVRLYARQCLARVLCYHECGTARLDLELGSSIIEGTFPAVRACVEVDGGAARRGHGGAEVCVVAPTLGEAIHAACAALEPALFEAKVRGQDVGRHETGRAA